MKYRTQVCEAAHVRVRGDGVQTDERKCEFPKGGSKNIFRGISSENEGMDRVSGDYIGMMATIMNSVALQNELEKMNLFHNFFHYWTFEYYR